MPVPLPIAVDCPMAEVLDLARDSSATASLAPAGFGAPGPAGAVTGAPLPPPGDKVWFGTPSGDTLESDNFGVVWQPGEAGALEAQAALDALEAAWTDALVDGDWVHPWSSHDYLIWVVLDPYLGVEGRTVPIDSADFPDGVPVITLDPAGHADPDRFAVVAAHQFHHALQLRLRPESAPADAWFWESSASWGAARALPTNPVRYADADGFLTAPQTSLDAQDPAHARGLMLLNAWLDESMGLTTRDLWEAGRLAPGDDWETLLPAQTGLTLGSLFAGFSGAAANGALADSAVIGPITAEGPLTQGTTATLSRLGVQAWTYPGPDPAVVRITGVLAEDDVVAGSGAGFGREVLVQPGGVVTVTAGFEGAAYQLFYDPVDEEGSTDPPRAGRSDPSRESAIQGSCACSGAPSTGGWLGLVALAGLIRRRTR